MEFVKTIKVKVELDKKEKSAIETILHMFDNMWVKSENYEMENLWETYGSEEEGWVCIEDTLRNLLHGGK